MIPFVDAWLGRFTWWRKLRGGWWFDCTGFCWGRRWVRLQKEPPMVVWDSVSMTEEGDNG